MCRSRLLWNECYTLGTSRHDPQPPRFLKDLSIRGEILGPGLVFVQIASHDSDVSSCKLDGILAQRETDGRVIQGAQLIDLLNGFGHAVGQLQGAGFDDRTRDGTRQSRLGVRLRWRAIDRVVFAVRLVASELDECDLREKVSWAAHDHAGASSSP